MPISSPHSNWTRGNVCIRLAGGGDPDENIPLGCAQYFIAGSFVRSEIAYATPLPLFSSFVTFYMITLTKTVNVWYWAGHLHSRQRDGNRSLTTTYLTFSADGNELLVNMGGEQIYLFDINNPKNLKTCFGYSTSMYS